MLTLLDVSNFWSPTGGGVRRYHLEKMAALQGRDDVRYVLVIPDRERRTETRGNVILEHVPSSQLPGSGGYRQILTPRWLKAVIDERDPDLIECGSPWILPPMVRRLSKRAAVVGFWHADFPRAHFGRTAEGWHPSVKAAAERAGWAFARQSYGPFDAILCASRRVAQTMYNNGLDRIYLTPLGVHADQFHPSRRDDALTRRFLEDRRERKILVFAHRMNEEKGLSIVLRAHNILSADMPVPPALVFAGLGPGADAVARHQRTHAHVHTLGYLEGREQLASVLATSDIALSLSAYETFGLSTAEAMACGTAVVAADEGSAAELVELSGGGRVVSRNAEALAASLKSLCDENRTDELGRRARRYAETLTWERAFETQLRVYREVVAAKLSQRRIAPGIHELGSFGAEGELVPARRLEA